MTLPIRVKVWIDRDRYLGSGQLVGHVTIAEAYKDIYHIATTEEVLELYLQNMLGFIARLTPDKLPQSLVEKLKDERAKELEVATTPKIILDSGATVYGCQIWWEPIEERKSVE